MTDTSRVPQGTHQLFEPFVAPTVQRLREQCARDDPGGEILDPDSISRGVADTLRADLARIGRPSLAANPAGRAESPARYPVPAQRIAKACEQAADTAAETVRRFAGDRAEIIDVLFAGKNPGRLTRIEPTTGDPHQGGRRVAFLHFEARTEPLVYKPRPLGSATLYTSMVEWLNARLPGLAMAGLPALVKDGYGWVGFLRHEPCSTSAEVELFYYRQGALLALLYAVNGTDAHADNVIAHGDQPVLIDTETLLHPVFAPRTLVGTDPALTALERSVYRTALLPTLVRSANGTTDVSGICGRADAAGNRPTLPHRPVEPGDHVPQMLRGFADAYTALSRDAESFGELLAGAEDVVTRFVPRPTRVYAELIEASLAPELLRDTDRVDALLENGLPPDEFENAGQLRAYECRDLKALDIPVFFARGGSRSIWSSDGERIDGFLGLSGVDAARAKVRAMNDADRRRQEWFIAAAFAMATGPLVHACATPLPVPRPAPPLDPQWALDQALAIAGRLDRLAYRDAETRRTNWLSLEPLEDGHLAILPAGAGLPHGYTGVALFLAQLGAVSRRSEYLERAHEVIKPLPHLLAALAQRPAHLAAIGGGFAGLGGIVYGLARLAELLDCPEIAADATAMAAALAAANAAAEPALGQGFEPLEDSGDGWCRGMAGRAAAGSIPPAALDAWLTRLDTLPPLSDFSLCHGELGILEALTVLAARQDGPDRVRARDVLERRRSLLPGAMRQGARCNGTPGDVSTPGLMHGLAGVGYGLLRTGFERSVPSVLMEEH